MKHRLIPIILLVIAVSAGFAAAEATQTPAVGVVNINTADQQTLQLLPRVGPSLSARIVAFREANGNFKSVDELVAVKGIGETSIESLKPYLIVSGKTTLTEKVRLPRTKSDK